jgi:hypothetical protein
MGRTLVPLTAASGVKLGLFAGSRQCTVCRNHAVAARAIVNGRCLAYDMIHRVAWVVTMLWTGWAHTGGGNARAVRRCYSRLGVLTRPPVYSLHPAAPCGRKRYPLTAKTHHDVARGTAARGRRGRRGGGNAGVLIHVSRRAVFTYTLGCLPLFRVEERYDVATQVTIPQHWKVYY